MKLYDFQGEGRDFLAGRKRAYLADDMGLGKTVQALAAAQIVKPEHPLVVCPANAIGVWRRTYHELPCGADELGIVSYSWLARHPEYLHAYKGAHDLVILDEAHYTKNMESQRTRSALAIASHADRAWALSGTPLPNHVGEIYPVLRALWPKQLVARGLTSYASFLDRYAVVIPGEYGPKIIGAKNGSELRSWLRTIMLRRKLDDVDLQLPELRWENVPVPFPTEDDLLAELTELSQGVDVEAVIEGMHADPFLARLRRVLGTIKARPAGRMLHEEMASTPRKIVVLGYHRAVLDELERQLSNFGVIRLDGRTSPRDRLTIEDRFNNPGGPLVFLGQLTAAKEALTLTSAREVVLVEQLWSPMDNLQAVKRIHRIGQSKPCRARQMFLEGTIDEAVLGVCNRKLKAVGQIIHV